jgi:hypothetical protein
LFTIRGMALYIGSNTDLNYISANEFMKIRMKLSENDAA